MPILRKIMRVSGSIAVFIPPSWLKLIEKQVGRPVDYVLMNINEKITIEPYIPKEQAKKEEPIELMPEIEEVS